MNVLLYREGSAYSKRRTSILKMPRKSSWSSEVQQPEHVVECVKPSDKRMSKRVSFAAANDVLLFSKDVKNTSASPTPLQELTPDNATQQWIQMKTGEDEQFSACLPLQPNVLSDSNYGKSTNCINQEECLLSSAEQGENMDMTLSQTFNMFCDKDESTAFPFTNTHSAVYYDITDKENYFPKMKSVIKATDPLHCLFPQDIFTCPDKPNNKTTEMVFTREPSDNNQRLTMKPEPLSGDRSSSGLPLQPEPLCEDQTVCFTAHDAGMDMTQCQTTLISRDMLPSTNMQPKQEAVATLPALGVNLAFENFFASLSGQKNEVKKTLRSNVKLAAETQSSSRLSKRPLMGAQSCHVPRIQRPSVDVDAEQPPRERNEDLPREKTIRFAAEDLLHPVDSSVNLQQELPFSEKTTRFDDALMDVTQCLTVKIAKDCAILSDDSSILPKCGENTSQFICDEATADNPIHHSTTINAEEGVMDKTRCITSNIGVEMKASLSDLSHVCTCVTADVSAALKRREPMVFSNQRSRSLNRHDANAVLNVRRSMPWGNPLPQETAETDDYSEVIHLNDGRGVLSIIEESIAEAKPKCENVDNSTTEASVQINTESGVGNEQTVVEPLAQSEVEIHQCSPQTHDEDQVVVDETEQSPASMRKDPELELGDGEAQQTFERDADFQKSKCKSSTTPFKLETKRLMSRLSVVGFMPKLGKRSQSEEAKTPNEPATAQIHTARFDLNVSDIKNEELGSYEDVSETLDSRSPDKEPEDMAVFGGFELDQELQDKIFEEEALVNEKKRPLEDEERTAEDEKRIRTSNDTVILDSQACTLVGDNITSAANTQTTISSICNHTVSLRCEGTLESSSMQSIYEYSLEDYANDIERKFEDGNITMLEFFKFFHMDFVIHNSRQSVAPGRVSSDVESSQMDVSRDRHIHAPRQQVYKADVRCLTEQVEGLKFRMRDLNKPLYLVNKALWEEMKNFTEGEFKSFSAKLKEIYSTCRKTSRAKAHEMKEGLYTDLLRANAEVQEKLRGSIQRADTMLNNLDDCMAKLEAELAALEGDVKRGQEELSTVTDAISDHERSASELQVQNMYSADKLRRVKEEAKDVDRRLTMLHRMNEWRLKEMTRTTSIYTFLYETLHLKLTYEDTEGNDERKIVDVSLKHLLDERSQGHARLVHALLSQVTQAQSWTKRYSSSKDVFDLLRELSLMVSRCRLLGEEVRLLDTWGSMSLDILDIHCVQTDVYITFSSLQRLQKFEVVFSVCLTNQLYTLQLKSFRNVMGDTTIQNIQEVLSSITPGHKYLTKTIKSIHERFLS
uniref:Knl1 C-terminal RWD domain-containing protein n=1 Tax=Knipowitschia caucasica TaxID=637954 RepID=A0AAV2KAT2_KNICA